MRRPTSNGGREDVADLRGQIPPMTPDEMEAALTGTVQKVIISAPRMEYATLHIEGTSPYVQHAFSQKSQIKMEAAQRAGTRARSRKSREERQFEADYEAAKHVAEEGWLGIPASAFRNGMISACRLVGFAMTRAKLSIFVDPHGIDANDGTPLIKIIGEPRIHKGWGRNADGGADLRWRPMWVKWEAMVPLHWDLDQFNAQDVLNLMSRVGLQVGIGEGRPDSPKSNGLGWGLFKVLGAA